MTGENDGRQVHDTRIQGIAPHVSLAFEAEVTKRITIHASVKEIVGKGKRDNPYSPVKEDDIHFGGQEIKVGLRFYF
jgi:hypothetical protein